MPDVLYVIDVFSLVFQVFHAVPEMVSPSGLPTNAVFGFTRDILNLLKQKQPSHLICALDSSGPGMRDQMRQMSVISAMDLLRRTLLAS